MFSWEEELDEVLNALKKSRGRITNIKELVLTGKISKQTQDSLMPQFQRDLVEAERRKKDLLGRLTNLNTELTEQYRVLVRLNSDLEMKLAYSLVSEDHYIKITTALKYGLDETIRELEGVSMAIKQLSEETTESTPRVLDRAIRRLDETGQT